MSKTILIVDDQSANRQLLATLLGSRDYRLLEAADGTEALALVRAERPNLVITDILMPTMDGYELVHRLRADPILAATPVIFYTGAYDPEEVQRLASTGGVFLLIKPVRAEAILREVEAALGTAVVPTVPEQWEEFDREHLRLLTDKLAQKVSELEQEVEERKRMEEEGARLNSHLRLLLESTGEGIYGIDMQGRCTFINRVGAQMLGYTPEELIGQNMHALAHHSHADGSRYPVEECPIFQAFRSGQNCRVSDEVFWRKDSTWFPLEYSSFPILDGQTIQGAVVTLLDITERKRAEEALKTSEHRFRELAENIREVFWMAAPDFRQILYVSPAYESIWGRSCESLYQQPLAWAEAIHPDDRERTLSLAEQQASGGYDVEYRIVRPDGSLRWIHDRAFPIRNDAGEVYRIAGIAEDITRRKQAEETLRASEERYRLLFEACPIGYIHMNMRGQVQAWNPAAEQIFGWSAAEAIAHSSIEFIIPEASWPRVKQFVFQLSHGQPAVESAFENVIPDGRRTMDWDSLSSPDAPGNDAPARDRDRLMEQLLSQMLQAHQPVSSINKNITKDGRAIICDWLNIPLRDAAGNATGFLSIVENITERKQAEEQLKRQFDRLTAMRAIDAAILSSLDLRITLNLIVEQALTGLDSPAARILLLTPHTHTLEFAAGRGFPTNYAAPKRLRLGEGYAGRAALVRLPVHIPNLNETDEIAVDSDGIKAAGFVEYHAVPLVAKGIVKGVLEVCDRQTGSRDADWKGFLEILADQAAIAIDNATLFNDLQHTNAELIVAYDATLEGWVQALDLRDKETEGHSLRVTEMTLRLAEAMGLRDKELAQVRRGALLHDIGKLGIPDEILLKPGALTAEEWKVMRRHPEYAYNWLWPIAFLRPALDIPYCHHEKWDGTGYPHGLKAEQIPLAARIFAVVDVWDALCSDRPYRKAWPEEKVREHILSQRGSHFDPAVVDVFLELHGE